MLWILPDYIHSLQNVKEEEDDLSVSVPMWHNTILCYAMKQLVHTIDVNDEWMDILEQSTTQRPIISLRRRLMRISFFEWN